MKRPHLSLSQKSLLAVIVILLPILITFVLDYNNNKKKFRENLLADLSVTAEAYEELVHQFLKTSKRRAQDFSSDGFIRENLQRISRGDGSAVPLLNEHLKKNKISLDETINAIYILSLDGLVAASTETSAIGKDISDKAYFASGKEGMNVADIGTERTGMHELAVSAPVTDRDTGEPIGVLANFISLSGLNEVLYGEFENKKRPTIPGTVKRETMEQYLVNGDKLFITESIFVKDAPLKQTVDTVPVGACLELKKEMTGLWKDYRGIDIAGSSRCISEMDWTLLVEVDAAEMMAPARHMLWDAFITGVIVVGLIGGLLVGFIKKVVGPLRRITSAAEKVGSGDYKVRIPLQTKDEIGKLAESFNAMAGDIEARTTALVKSESRLSEAQRIARLGNWEWDIVTNELWWSDEVYRIFGLKPREFGATFEAFMSTVHPEDREFVKKSVTEALQEKKPYGIDHRIVLPGGTERIVHEHAEVTCDDEGRPARMAGTVQDVTEHRRAEDALRTSETRYRTMLQSATDAIITMGEDELISEFNEAAESMFGYSADEVTGKNVDILMPERYHKRHKEAFKRVLATRKSALAGKIRELEALRKDGTEFPMSITMSPIEIGGEFTFLAIIRDITERKEAEEELNKYHEHLEELVEERTAELKATNRELEAFSYSVSHDLRAPLRSIDGFSQVVLEDYKDKLDEEGKDSLNRVRRASQKMAGLIDDMLKLSRLTQSEMKIETVDISSLAISIVEELRSSEPKRKTEFIVQEGISAEGDKTMLKIMLENLLGNAWKFTGKKPDTRIEFGVLQIKDKTEYFVRDNGAGFDMTYAEKLFIPFQRLHAVTEFPGTGIGLAIVQRVINRHGGSIRPEGAVGQGATFFFTL